MNKIRIYQILFFIGIVLFWEALVRFGIVADFILAPPSEVFPTLIQEYEVFMRHTLATLTLIFGGLLIAFIVAVVLAIVFVHSRTISEILEPYIFASYTFPKIAIAAIIVLLMPPGIPTQLFIVVLICFFPMLVNLTRGLKSVNPDHLDLLHIQNATRMQILMKARIPSSLPYFFSGLKVSTFLAIKGALIAEFFSGDKGVGYLIYMADSYFRPHKTYAALMIIGLIAWTLTKLVSYSETRVLHWHESEREILRV